MNPFRCKWTSSARWFQASLQSIAVALGLPWATLACGNELSCPRSVEEFCKDSGSVECAHLDYPSALEAACNATGIRSFGACGGYDILSREASDGGWISAYFSEGRLEVITSGADEPTACLAGPGEFEPPTCSDRYASPCGYTGPASGGAGGGGTPGGSVAGSGGSGGENVGSGGESGAATGGSGAGTSNTGGVGDPSTFG
jgi:hypothetical protein